MTEERLRHVLPTVTSIAARLTLAVLKKQNVAVAPLLRRAGLSEHDFDGRQHRISAASQAKFLELRALSDFTWPRTQIRVKRACYSMSLPPHLTSARRCRSLHVTAGSPLPLVTEDRHLLETLRPICDEAAKERGTATGTLRAVVENEAQNVLPHGKAKRHRVAKSLGLSERTLTRKLADEGTTYEQVSDQLRRSLALQYIKELLAEPPERGGFFLGRAGRTRLRQVRQGRSCS